VPKVGGPIDPANEAHDLHQQRAALEAGADPIVVTGWMKATQAQRALAEARLITLKYHPNESGSWQKPDPL
jgi:hypothetical protein